MTRETVTVVIPAFDAERFVAEAVATARAQVPPPAEIVIVDDGSSDATAAVAESVGARLLRQPHRGIGAARNAGIRAARAGLVALLDVDDLWLPGKLAAQLAAFDEDPGLAGVFTGIRNQFMRPELEDRFQAAAGVLPGVCASTLLARRDVLLEAGGFNETTSRTDFIEWYATAVASGARFRMLEGLYALRRIHGRNNSIRAAGATGEYVRLARQLIAQQRRAAAQAQDDRARGVESD